MRVEIEDINSGELMPSRLDQRHEVKFVHLLDLPKWNLSASWVFGSGRTFLEPEVNLITDNSGNLINYEVVNTSKTMTRLPAYHRLDLSITNRFKWDNADASWGISFFNIYGRQNTWYKEYDFSQNPTLITDVAFLGFTPNFSFSIDF